MRPSNVVRLAIVVVLAALSGCLTLGARGGTAVAIDGAPTRHIQGAFEIGTYVGFEKRFLFNPYLATNLGPLGASKRVPEYGANFMYTHPGLPLSPHLRVAFHDDCDATPADCASTFNLSLGVALLARASGGWSPSWDYAFAGVTAGIAYHHQTRTTPSNGHVAGDFLGLEISGRVGLDFIGALMGGTSDDPDPYGPDWLHR